MTEAGFQLLLLLILVLAVLAIVQIFRRRPALSAGEQRAAIRRMRVGLWAIQSELERLPATLEVHKLHHQAEHLHQQIEQVNRALGEIEAQAGR